MFDLHGHRLRHIEGEHDVFTGTDSSSYWLSNSEGKNEFLYDFTTDGPVQYKSAPFFFRGPDEGPPLPPGRYTLVFHLAGKTYRFSIEKRADPQSSTTAREYELQFRQSTRVYDLLGEIDVLLNQLHDAREHLATQKAALPAGSAATVSKVQAMLDATDATIASLTSSPANFEDSIQKQGQLREDVMALANAEPLAQASLQLFDRLEATYAQKKVAYDGWLREVAGWNATLKSVGLKPIDLSAQGTSAR